MANFINSAEILSTYRSPTLVHFQFVASDIPPTTATSSSRACFPMVLKAGTFVRSIQHLLTEAFNGSADFVVSGLFAVAGTTGSGNENTLAGALDRSLLTAANLQDLGGAADGSVTTITNSLGNTVYVRKETIVSSANNLVSPAGIASLFAPTVVSAPMYAPVDAVLLFDLKLEANTSASTGVLKVAVELSNVKLDGIKAALTITAQAAE